MSDKEKKFYTVTIGNEKNLALTPAGTSLPQLIRYTQERKGARLTAFSDDHPERFIRYKVADTLKSPESNIGLFFTELYRQDQYKYDDFADGFDEKPWRKKIFDPRDAFAPVIDKKAPRSKQESQRRERSLYYKAKMEMYESARDRRIKVRLIDDKNNNADGEEAFAWRNRQMANAIISDMKHYKNKNGLLLMGRTHLERDVSSLLDQLKELDPIRIDILPVARSTLRALEDTVFIGGMKGADYTVVVPSASQPFLEMHIQRSGRLTDSPHKREWLDIQMHRQRQPKPQKEMEQDNGWVISPPSGIPALAMATARRGH